MLGEKCTVEELRKVLYYLMRGYKVPDIVYDVIFKVAKKEVEEKKRVVLLKRDPNIHRDRIQAFYVKVIEGETVEIHPGSVGGFGADFDGDSVYCDVMIFYKTLDGNMVGVILNISEFNDVFLCKKVSEYTRDDGVKVSEYELLEDVYIDAIDMETGKNELKKILKWSVHENIEMYDIEGKGIEKFSVSTDHSLVVYDEKENKIVRASITEIMKEPSRYYLIKRKENKHENDCRICEITDKDVRR